MSEFSVKKAYTIFVGVILIIILGVISFTKTKIDLLPNMDLPYVAIITTYIGASPEKIENSVTKIIEEEMLSVSNIENVSSVSSENSSMVILEFSQTSNMDSIMIEISQKMDMVKSNFEDGVGTPIVMKINPNMMPIMMTAIDVDNANPYEITKFVQESILPELERIDGVASISTIGAIEEEIKVNLNQTKIDGINDKVLESVDKELYKVKKELDSAKSKIESGKQEVSNQQKEQTTKIIEGLAAIDSGKEEMLKAELELNSKYNELNTTKSSVESAISQLNQAEKLIIAFETMKKNVTDLENQKTSLEIQRDNLEAKAQNGPLSPEEIQELTQINTSITAISNSIVAIQQNPDYIALETQYNTIKSTYPDLASKKAEAEAGLVQINSGIAAIEEGKVQLQEKKTEINNKRNELELAKSTLESELTKASSQLQTSQIELEKGIKEFEDARDKAYESASLDGIITATMISGMLTAENFSMPAGYIEDGKILVKVGEKFSSIDEIKELTLFSFDIKGLENVTLQDVADIELTDNSDETYAKINNNNGIILSFSKQSTASTKEVSEKINEVIKKLENQYDNISFTNLMDQGIYIDMIIGSVLNNLLIGGLLAIIILFFFLKEVKPTIIIALSIPISLTFAIVLMYFTGVSINIISLSGLALGVGMLVDNSIVVIENIYRLKQEGKQIKEACIDGAKTVSGAIFASTLTTICVFLPIVFTEGITRQLFTDMGLTIAYSLIASLIVALTLVPAMSSKILQKTSGKENNFFNKITTIYEKSLNISLKHKWTVIVFVIIMLGMSIFLATRMGTEFMPSVEGSEISMTINMPKETTKEEVRNISNSIIEKLMTIDDIEKIGAIETSGMSLMSMGTGDGISMYILLKEEKIMSNEEIANRIKELTEEFDCEIEISTSNMDMSALTGSGISVLISGDDLDKLKDIGKDIEDILYNVEGIEKVEGISDSTKSEQRIEVNKNKAMEYGLTVAQVYSTIANTISNEVKSTTLEVENKQYPIIIVKPIEDEIKLDNIMDIELDGTKNNEKTTIKLSEIATISESTGLESISRNNNGRYISISGIVKPDYNIGLVSRDFETKLGEYEIPEGYEISLSGENENINQALKDLAMMILLAVSFIYLIMVAQFQSLKLPFIIMFTMPLAFTGGLLSLFMAGMEISVIAMLGFLVLAGIVVNNGIVFIDYINQLREGGKERIEAIKEAGRTRLRPIIMTALTTILGLSTMALGLGSGAEMTKPLGVVTIGGLIYSTLLTLYFIPCLYDILCKKK